MIRRSVSSYAAVLLLLTVLLGACSAAPATSATYDQRQEGGINVDVDLENFVILVARPSAASASSGLDLFGSMAGVLLDAKRAAASAKESEDKEQRDAEGKEAQHQQEAVERAQVEAEEHTQQDKEDKEPEKVVLLVQEGERAGRSLEDIVRTLRNLKSKQPIKEEARGSIGKYKFVDSVEEPQNLKLVGDGLENCGPGRSRDRLGICEGDAALPE